MVYGDPNGAEGSLYVLRKGRRFHVGVAKRFELVFSRGVLASWYDLSVDPDKTIDLAGGGTAGPVLTALDDTGVPSGPTGIDSWTHLGKNVQTQQQIAETNSLAVTIKGTIRFAAVTTDNVEGQTASANTGEPPSSTQPTGTRPDSTQADGGAIEHTYLYTIRRDGRIFVDIQAQVASPTVRPSCDRTGRHVPAVRPGAAGGSIRGPQPAR